MKRDKESENKLIKCQPIILAAGESKRFKTSSLEGSKILTRIKNRTLLELQLERLSSFPPPIIVVRREDVYNFDKVVQAKGVIVVVDEKPQNPVSSVIAGAPYISVSTTHVLIVLGDMLCSSAKMIKRIKNATRNCNIGMVGVSPLMVSNTGSSVVIIKKGKLIGSTLPNNIGGWRWIGIALLPVKWLKELSVETNLINQITKLANRGYIIKVVKENGICININTEEELKIAEKLF